MHVAFVCRELVTIVHSRLAIRARESPRRADGPSLQGRAKATCMVIIAFLVVELMWKKQNDR